MLTALRVRDIAIIDELEFEPGRGFTCLTGETGAGKSILVDALTMALGARATSELIRTGADKAEVEAVFDISNAPAVKEFLAERGIADSGEAPGELIVRRHITRQGKNRLWICGRNESAQTLFELGRLLVDIYGQHEYQTLLKPERHRELLDSFGGLGEVLADYRAAYGRWREARDKLRALGRDEKSRLEREDLLRFRISEIESARLEPGEDEKLDAEREVLRHAGLLKEAGAFGVDYLYESDQAVAGGLRELSGRLGEAASHDPWFKIPLEQVESARALLEDAALELRGHVEGIDADPARLQWVDDRIHDIKELKRKYGSTVDDILATLDEAKAELASFENAEEMLAELEAKEKKAREAAEEKADALTIRRAEVGADLCLRVVRELASLGMEKTRFEVRLDPAEEIHQAGADNVAFYISPNPGEDLKPLDKIASGGELSRIMLALRALLSGETDVMTLVFDEVDTGIGGAVAEAVGLRMRDMASGRQVLCVTHLPRIAALAGDHFVVEKSTDGGRARTRVRALGREERVGEISRMLGGAEVTDAARAHAEEMLKDSARPEAARGAAKPKARRKKSAAGAKGGGKR